MKSVTLKCLVLLLISLLLIIFHFRSDLKSQLSLKQFFKPHYFRGKLAKITQVKYHKSGKKQQRRETRKKIQINSKIRNRKGALIHFRAIESIMDLHGSAHTFWQKPSTCAFPKVSKYIEGSLFPLLFSKQQFRERISWAIDLWNLQIM